MVTGVCSIGVLNNHRGDLFLNSLLPLVPRGLDKGGSTVKIQVEYKIAYSMKIQR